MHRRSFLAAGGAATLAPPAYAISGRAREKPRVLRFVPEGALTNPDPVWTHTTVARTHGYLVWDTLYGQDSAGRVSPQMAAGHELADDRLRWRFFLRDGLFFHDNEKVRAQDCVASILRWARWRSFGQALLARLDDIRALDDRRFEIRLRRPFPPLLEALGTGTCFIMPERLARGSPLRAVPEYIGSGPFRFLGEEWAAGARAAYARWDRYLPAEGKPDFSSGGKLANFDRVEWTVIADPAAAAAALQQGEVDWVQLPLIEQLPVLREAPGVSVAVNDRIGVIALIAFNHLHPPFDNPQLLRALLPAVDQPAFVQAAMGSEAALYHVPAGVFTAGLPMASEAGLEVLTDPRDPGLTRRLVAESRYNGEKVVLMSPSDYPATQSLCQVARDLFEQAGLNVEYVSMDWHTLEQRRTSREPPDKGGWSSFCTTYDGLALATPSGHLPIRGNWFGSPGSPRLEALREAWFAAPDLAAQRDVCAQIQQAVWEEVPYIPLGQWFNPTAMRRNLVDVVPAPFPVFWGVRRA